MRRGRKRRTLSEAIRAYFRQEGHLTSTWKGIQEFGGRRREEKYLSAIKNTVIKAQESMMYNH